MTENLVPRVERRASMAALRAAAMLNAGAVVVAALYFGQELLVPLVLAGLLAFVLAPLVRLLQRARLPHAAAVLLAVVLGFAIIGGLSAVVAQQIGVLAGQAPTYQANVMAKWQRLVESHSLLQQLATPLSNALGSVGGSSLLALAERVARPLLGPLVTTAVVLVFTLVILLYSEDLRDRFIRLVGRSDLHRAIFALNDAARRLSRYYLSQLLLNAGFGLSIGGALAAVGLPSPILLGLLAMLMRFVPFIGTFVGLVPVVGLAVAVGPDWSLAVIVLALYVVSEMIVSQVLEPLLYGHSTGISPVAVLVATSFWALLWGFVGLLIATPLTVCLVVIGRNVSPLAFLDVLFGSESPLLPAETFYQRALEGRSLVLVRAARAQIESGAGAEYYDRIALPGLALALRDGVLRDGALNELDEEAEEDRVDMVHDQVQALLAALGPAADAAPGGDILCLPARGPFDDLGAAMLAQILTENGFPSWSAANTVLDNNPSETVPLEAVRLCCLSAFEASTSMPTLRVFLQAIRRTMPEATIVIALWGAAKDSALLAEIRAEGTDEHVILSLGELVAYVRAAHARPASPSAQRTGPPGPS